MRKLFDVASALWITWALCSCGPQRGPTLYLPMTAAEAVAHGSGEALVAYLGQRDASPAICDLLGRGPHLRIFAPSTRSALMKGFREGRIPVERWTRCMELLLSELSDDQIALIFDELVVMYRLLLTDDELENDPVLVARLSTVHRLYLRRKPGTDAHAAVLDPWLDELRTALAKKRVPAVAEQFARELVEDIEIAGGSWQGQRVDTALMDRLAGEGKVLTLTAFAARLPTQLLRDEARTRIVRVNMSVSPFMEVRAAGPALAATVLKLGRNPIALRKHPMRRARFAQERIAERTIVVRQDVKRRAATLLGASTRGWSPSVLPELPLRGTLLAEFDGVSREVSVCGDSNALDPSPCIDVASITVNHPATRLDDAGTVHFVENLALAHVLPWAALDRFSIPVNVGAVPAGWLQWELRFERPPDVIFDAQFTAGMGPDLTVHVTLPRGDRVRFDIAEMHGSRFAAVVELDELSGFRIVSRGGQGETGTPGSQGAPGMPGGECSNGMSGMPGGVGGPGGKGGDGGDINVEIVCSQTATCAALQTALAEVIVSVGGPGGPGGVGGPGGPGGMGGSGRAETSHFDTQRGCRVVDNPGCSSGSMGIPGAMGIPGPSGPSGMPGRVTFEVRQE